MTLSHYLLVELQLGLDILGGVGDADLDAPRDAPRNDPFQGLNNNKKIFNDYQVHQGSASFSFYSTLHKADTSKSYTGKENLS